MRGMEDTMDEWTDILQVMMAYCGDLAHQRILDVGCDTEGYTVEAMVSQFNALEAVGLNLVGTIRPLPPRCKRISADVRKIPYPDNYFDLIFSSSAFEHLPDLDVALDEMYRVLKPGGQLFTHFGPLWSTSYGHHLWLNHEGRTYTYWNVVLPAFCHLLQSPQEVYETLLLDHSSELSEAIANYVFDSPEQNRLFFDDFEYLFQNSRFKVVFFKGYDTELSRVYLKTISPVVLQQLKSRYPRCSGFLYDGITAVLKKPT